jgi:hypothetical protein
LLATVYDDSEGEWVDDEFVNDCLVLADGNNDGVLQIEGKKYFIPRQSPL